MLHCLCRDHKAYYLLSRHYKWALEQVFDVLGFEYAIILGTCIFS
jgi:hypothetical protein